MTGHPHVAILVRCQAVHGRVMALADAANFLERHMIRFGFLFGGRCC